MVGVDDMVRIISIYW